MLEAEVIIECKTDLSSKNNNTTQLFISNFILLKLQLEFFLLFLMSYFYLVFIHIAGCLVSFLISI